jgi:hypothetical protein
LSAVERAKLQTQRESSTRITTLQNRIVQINLPLDHVRAMDRPNGRPAGVNKQEAIRQLNDVGREGGAQAHADADDILLEFLEDAGFNEVAAAWDSASARCDFEFGEAAEAFLKKLLRIWLLLR